jgi:hypothetical protein
VKRRTARTDRLTDSETSCTVGDGMPDCATGAFGRLRFVERELMQVFKQLWGAIRRKKDSR